jgi:flagellar biosynthesis protein FlhG
MEIPQIDPDAEVSGVILKNLRESAGASLREVAEISKISTRYLRAIEENDFDALPAEVYVRGFASEYARILGVDAAAFARAYMRHYRRYRGEGG